MVFRQTDRQDHRLWCFPLLVRTVPCRRWQRPFQGQEVRGRHDIHGRLRPVQDCWHTFLLRPRDHFRRLVQDFLL